MVLSGLRGEDSIAALCRQQGIAQRLNYSGSKAYLEVSKKRLAGDVAQEATTDEVKQLRRATSDLREALAEQLKIIGWVERSHLCVRRTLATLGVSRPKF